MNRPDIKALLAFGACLVGAVLLTLVPSPMLGPREAAVLIPLLVLSVCLALVTARRDASSWDVAPALVFLVLFAVLRHVTGGSLSSLSPVVVLPVLWVALFGTGRQLAAVAAGCASVIVAPLVLFEGSVYQSSDWRRAVLWVLIVAVMAPVIQRVVRDWVHETVNEREVRARLDAVMHAAGGHAIISTDTEGRVQTFNSGAERMLGYRAVDVRQRSMEILHDPFELHERMLTPPATQFASLVLHGAPDHEPVEWTLLRADGTRVPVELTVSQVTDRTGRVSGFVAIAHDLTDVLAARRRLQADERRWRVLLERLPDTAVLLVDEDLNYREVVADDAPWQSLSTGGQVGSMVAPDMVDRLRAVYSEALHGGTATAELHSSCSDSIRQVSAVPLPDYDGRREALVVVRDVTADRRRERALVAATERIRRIFEASPYGGALVELDGTIHQVNPMFEVILGRSDLVGRQLGEVLDVAEQDAIEAHLRGLLASGDDRLATQWATRTRSGISHLAVTSVLLRAADGAPERVLLQCVDDSARHQQEQQLTFLANHDALTGLANRRSFATALGAQVELCRRYGPDGALLMIDLDGFKWVNDTFGHAAGDAVLVDLAELLRDRLRATDIVARLGGDEFAVLLPRTDRSVALELAERIRVLVRSSLRTVDGQHPISASIGVVVLDGDNAEQLLLRADRAMYAAKQAGRDCLVLAPH